MEGKQKLCRKKKVRSQNGVTSTAKDNNISEERDKNESVAFEEPKCILCQYISVLFTFNIQLVDIEYLFFMQIESLPKKRY